MIEQANKIVVDAIKSTPYQVMNENVNGKLLRVKKLFQPELEDDNIKMINGDTTNLLNLENIKYQWAHNIFDELFSNNWLPHKTPMGNDKSNFKQLTEDEQNAYKDIISFLVFLDSIQTNNLPNISEYITAPDVVYVLGRQTMDEVLHSKSYGWILSSIFTHSEATKIVYRWRENKTLLDRNRFITEQYQNFKDNPTDINFISAVVCNYLLEGLYFYNGFQFFHNLASRNLMIATDTQIRYIQRDESQHCEIFKHIILELQREEPELMKQCEEHIYTLFRQAVEWEIRFSNEIIGNKIMGITERSIHDYTHHLANKRLKDIKMQEIFEKVKDPYTHLELIAGVDNEASNRVNNFESTSISYKNISAISGMDDI